MNRCKLSFQQQVPSVTTCGWNQQRPETYKYRFPSNTPHLLLQKDVVPPKHQGPGYVLMDRTR